MYFFIIIGALVLLIRIMSKLSLETVVKDVLDNMVKSEVITNAISSNIGSYISADKSVSVKSVLSWLLSMNNK
jgi:hypothetical protein